MLFPLEDLLHLFPEIVSNGCQMPLNLKRKRNFHQFQTFIQGAEKHYVLDHSPPQMTRQVCCIFDACHLCCCCCCCHCFYCCFCFDFRYLGFTKLIYYGHTMHVVHGHIIQSHRIEAKLRGKQDFSIQPLISQTISINFNNDRWKRIRMTYFKCIHSTARHSYSKHAQLSSINNGTISINSCNK